MNEEIKQLIELRINAGVIDNRSNYALFNEGMRKGSEIAKEIILSKWQEAERWRKVEEELPDTDTAVLCRMKSPNVIVEGFIYKYNGIAKIETQPDFEFEDYANGEVIEWKPIS